MQQNALLWLAGALMAAQVAPEQGPPAKLDANECAVWRRELSFAQSVEKHDAKAFAAHLHPGAIFNAGTNSPARGSEAVKAAWAPLIEGKELILRWHPDVVNIGGDRNIAVSTGPFMMEEPSPNAKVRFQVGRFISIWTRKSAKDEWLVLFDGGGSPPVPVKDKQEALEYMAKAPKTCPAR